MPYVRPSLRYFLSHLRRMLPSLFSIQRFPYFIISFIRPSAASSRLYTYIRRWFRPDPSFPVNRCCDNFRRTKGKQNRRGKQRNSRGVLQPLVTALTTLVFGSLAAPLLSPALVSLSVPSSPILRLLHYPAIPPYNLCFPLRHLPTLSAPPPTLPSLIPSPFIQTEIRISSG